MAKNTDLSAPKPDDVPPKPVPWSQRAGDLQLVAGHGVEVSNVKQAALMAEGLAVAGLLPRGMDPPKACITIIQGFRFGWDPMTSVQNICLINNRPSVYGKAAIDLLRRWPSVRTVRQGYKTRDAEGAWAEVEKFNLSVDMPLDPAEWGGAIAAFCEVVIGNPGENTPDSTIIGSFSVMDARRAGLWMDSRRDPWCKYPLDMLGYKALHRAIAQAAPGCMMGMPILEDIRDAFAPVEVEVPFETVELGADVDTVEAVDHPKGLKT